MAVVNPLFLLFPTAVGEDDVTTRHEAPVLLTASANASATDAHRSPARESHQLRGSSLRSGVVSLNANTSAEAAAAVELCRLHYVTASHLCALQHGKVLARCLPLSPSGPCHPLVTPFAGQVELEHGRRCFYFCPVEEGRYLVVVCLPHRLLQLFGGGEAGSSIAHSLVQATLTSHPLPPSALRPSASDETVTYATLHTRLTDSASLVHKAMSAPLHQVTRIAAEVATSAPRRCAPRLAALHRLCREDVSPLRAHPRLQERIDRLLRCAVSPTSPASLRGGLPTMGTNGHAHRYVVTASAVWYRGHPLYSSATPAEQQQQCMRIAGGAACSSVVQLRSAAVAVLLDEMAALQSATGKDDDWAYTDTTSAPVRLTTWCSATAPSTPRQTRSGTTASGYISHPLFASPAQTRQSVEGPATPPVPCGVTMALTSTAGWTVSLLLRPIRTPYVGAPLPVIFGGLQSLLTDALECEDVVSLMQASTVSMRQTWRRPMQMVSPLVAQLEAAVVRIQVYQRLPGTCPATAEAATLQDRVLYSLQPPRMPTPSSQRTGAVKRSTSSPAAGMRCAAPLTSLGWANAAAKREAKRTAALVAAHAAVLQRRQLSECDDESGGLSHHQRRMMVGVEPVVQTAMRYGTLMAHLQRCRGAASSSLRHRPPSSSPLTHAQQGQSYAVRAVLTDGDTVRLVRAVPHACSGATSPARMRYAVTYVVVEVMAKKVPNPSCTTYDDFTAWILSRCL